MIGRDFVRIGVPLAALLGKPFASRHAGLAQPRQFTAFDPAGFKDELNLRATRSNLAVAIASINAPPILIVGIATPRSTSPHGYTSPAREGSIAVTRIYLCLT